MAFLYSGAKLYSTYDGIGETPRFGIPHHNSQARGTISRCRRTSSRLVVVFLGRLVGRSTDMGSAIPESTRRPYMNFLRKINEILLHGVQKLGGWFFLNVKHSFTAARYTGARTHLDMGATWSEKRLLLPDWPHRYDFHSLQNLHLPS